MTPVEQPEILKPASEKQFRIAALWSDPNAEEVQPQDNYKMASFHMFERLVNVNESLILQGISIGQ